MMRSSVTAQRSTAAAGARHLAALPPRHWRRSSRQRTDLKTEALDASSIALLADLSFEDVTATAKVLGTSEKVVLVASVAFSALSLGINFLGGVETEKKRAELAKELEREKQQQQALVELTDVTARYRGPLLEAAIDLEQTLWHLITDAGWRLLPKTDPSEPPKNDAGREEGGSQAVDSSAQQLSSPAGAVPSLRTTAAQQEAAAVECAANDICYFLFTLGQFLGFLEVLRREGPRERAFLQAGNPHGSDTLSTLNEGIRFVMCASQGSLQRWYLQGRDRPHPGCRSRSAREEVIREAMAQRAEPSSSGSSSSGSCAAAPTDALRVSRGTQRGIGTFMITTPMGAPRHYTMAYGDFYMRLQADPAFHRWFAQVEADAVGLSRLLWAGEAAFPAGPWTRALLLQQLLVELIDLLDPDCVRVPLARRTRLMPLSWGRLPGLEQYQAQLKSLSPAFNLGQARPAGPSLDGIRDLLRPFEAEQGPAPTSTDPDQQPPAGAASQAP